MNIDPAENRDLTDRDIINQRNPSPTRTRAGHGVLHGTDFRHAVEFSRSGRAGIPASRPSSLAALDVTPRFAAVSPGGSHPLASRPARRRENGTPPSRARAKRPRRDAPHPTGGLA